jgi:hypothetical protein
MATEFDKGQDYVAENVQPSHAPAAPPATPYKGDSIPPAASVPVTYPQK